MLVLKPCTATVKGYPALAEGESVARCVSAFVCRVSKDPPACRTSHGRFQEGFDGKPPGPSVRLL